MTKARKLYCSRSGAFLLSTAYTELSTDISCTNTKLRIIIIDTIAYKVRYHSQWGSELCINGTIRICLCEDLPLHTKQKNGTACPQILGSLDGSSAYGDK